MDVNINMVFQETEAVLDQLKQLGIPVTWNIDICQNIQIDREINEDTNAI